ncbi:unnamed protein product [Prorocentrum cordatum]|uniref:Uncharacterized protein n=1 Tax=Prorocentrum cordatum TaxID=2364126 RepID=A0ABN9T318_9DINO|nr:unnamed protein product [Polarella glacialis]
MHPEGGGQRWSKRASNYMFVLRCSTDHSARDPFSGTWHRSLLDVTTTSQSARGRAPSRSWSRRNPTMCSAWSQRRAWTGCRWPSCRRPRAAPSAAAAKAVALYDVIVLPAFAPGEGSALKPLTQHVLANLHLFTSKQKKTLEKAVASWASGGQPAAARAAERGRGGSERRGRSGSPSAGRSRSRTRQRRRSPRRRERSRSPKRRDRSRSAARASRSPSRRGSRSRARKDRRKS